MGWVSCTACGGDGHDNTPSYDPRKCPCCNGEAGYLEKPYFIAAYREGTVVAVCKDDGIDNYVAWLRRVREEGDVQIVDVEATDELDAYTRAKVWLEQREQEKEQAK